MSNKYDTLISFVSYYASCPCCGHEVACNAQIEQPEQPWQDLSIDEISKIVRDSHAVENPHILPHTFAAAISKALKEKNERPTK
jgi:hypothetical protein